MALEVIDISRKEVERWLSAGTLNLYLDSAMRKDVTNDDYVLVSMFSCFAAHYDANWVPEVACTFDDLHEMEVAARNIEHEDLVELHGRYYCCSWQIWHLVDDVADVEPLPDLPGMNEEFAQWLYDRAFNILTHPNDFTAFQRRCAQVVEEWYAEQYCTPDDTFPWYIPDGAIEVVCQAFDPRDDGVWYEPDFGNELGGYNPIYAYIGDLYECKADILSDLQELRDAGDCERLADNHE